MEEEGGVGEERGVGVRKWNASYLECKSRMLDDEVRMVNYVSIGETNLKINLPILQKEEDQCT